MEQDKFVKLLLYVFVIVLLYMLFLKPKEGYGPGGGMRGGGSMGGGMRGGGMSSMGGSMGGGMSSMGGGMSSMSSMSGKNTMNNEQNDHTDDEYNDDEYTVSYETDVDDPPPPPRRQRSSSTGGKKQRKRRQTREGFEASSDGAMYISNDVGGWSLGQSTNVQPSCSRFYNAEGQMADIGNMYADVSQQFNPTKSLYNCSYKRPNEAGMIPERFVTTTINAPDPLLKGATYVGPTASVCNIKKRYADDPLLYDPLAFPIVNNPVSLNNTDIPIVHSYSYNQNI